MITSRSIYVVANGIVSFLWLSNTPLYIRTTSSLSIQSVDGHLGCFRVLAYWINIILKLNFQVGKPGFRGIYDLSLVYCLKAQKSDLCQHIKSRFVF